MTPGEATDRLAEIIDSAGDDEAAHSKEDALRHDVLQAIADGAPNAKVLAEIALRTSALPFARWCA